MRPLEHPAGFHAQVDGASLPDLIQMNCLGGRRAAFEVSSDGQVGHLFFDRGKLIHAEFRGSVGEEAVARLFALASGRFRPSQRPWPQLPTIHGSWESLLLRAAQAEDERGRQPRVARVVEFPSVGKVVEPMVEEADDVSASVRLSRTGNVLSSSGNIDTLAETAAFVGGLGNLVGDALGLGNVTSVEASSAEAVILVYREPQGNLVALRSSPGDMAKTRKRLGLE
jgi:hypothetical protein